MPPNPQDHARHRLDASKTRDDSLRFRSVAARKRTKTEKRIGASKGSVTCAFSRVGRGFRAQDSARRGAAGCGPSRPRATLENARGADPRDDADAFLSQNEEALNRRAAKRERDFFSRPAIEGFNPSFAANAFGDKPAAVLLDQVVFVSAHSRNMNVHVRMHDHHPGRLMPGVSGIDNLNALIRAGR